MISCLYPDCKFECADGDGKYVETAKRAVIDHINADHAEAHVLIACSHEWEEQERFDASTVNAAGVKVSFPQIKSQCVRCGQFEVKDDEPPVPPEVLEAVIDDTRTTAHLDGVTTTEGVTLDEGAP